MARIPLRDAEALAADLPEIADGMDLGERNITRALGNNPAALAAATAYIDALYDLLSATVREVAILAVAREKRSEYEWHQHVRIARAAGVPDATIRAIGTDDDGALEATDRAVVAFARAQCRGQVTDAQVDALGEAFTAADVVALSRLVANYAGTADFLTAMAVPLEDAFVGWVPG